MFFSLSGRRHLGGDIWKEASGRHLGGFRKLSGSSLGSSLGAGAAMGSYKGILDRKCCKFILFYSKNKEQNRLGFLGVGVTIVYVLQQLSASAEPERPCQRPPWSSREAARNPTVKALFR